MALRHTGRIVLGCTLAVGLYMAAVAAAEQEISRPPLKLASGRISIAGTSNIHAYTASTSDVRVTRVQFASSLSGQNFWDEIVKPGAIETFEVAIPAASLSSPKEGLDKNMHKALKVTEHADITFRLLRLEAKTDAPGAMRALGMLRIAGVEREVTLDLTTQLKDSTFTLRGELHLLMTDYGITPPKAMLGMLKTDPKVTVAFETALAFPLT